MARKKRQYSREFTPHGDGRNYTLKRIPAGLWTKVQLKAKREGVSLRALILDYLQAWEQADAETR